MHLGERRSTSAIEKKPGSLAVGSQEMTLESGARPSEMAAAALLASAAAAVGSDGLAACGLIGLRDYCKPNRLHVW